MLKYFTLFKKIKSKLSISLWPSRQLVSLKNFLSSFPVTLSKTASINLVFSFSILEVSLQNLHLNTGNRVFFQNHHLKSYSLKFKSFLEFFCCIACSKALRIYKSKPSKWRKSKHLEWSYGEQLKKSKAIIKHNSKLKILV